jgi:ABC-type transport system involved in multi-copper enzyme maturation permease subunit
MSATVILETLRRHFAHIAYIGAVLLVVVIAAAMAGMDAPSGSIFGVFTLFTLLAGCQIIGPEFSKGTLQLILSKPIHRSRYLLSRVAGVALALWIAIAVAYATDVITRLLGHHNVSWFAGGGTAAAVASQAVLVCSLMAFFGSFTRSYLNVALYLGGQIVISLFAGVMEFIQRVDHGTWAAVGAFLRTHPSVIGALRTIQDNIYPETPLVPFDRNWLLKVFGNAAIALLLACLIFRRREVPYGAD